MLELWLGRTDAATIAEYEKKQPSFLLTENATQHPSLVFRDDFELRSLSSAARASFLMRKLVFICGQFLAVKIS